MATLDIKSLMTPKPLPEGFQVYDTSLRDGAQQEGLNLSVADKLKIAGYLDELGVTFIEGGWPGANPNDTEFFELAKQLELKNSKLVAFGATRKAGAQAATDPLTHALVDAGTEYVCLVAKSHDAHVTRALRTTLDENLAMITDSVTYLRSQGKRVFLDCEHFFDGYLSNPEYAKQVVATSAEAGAEVVVLCDTNGGMLPSRIGPIVADVAAQTRILECTATTTPHALSPTPWQPSMRASYTCRGPSTVMANALATPTCRL